MALEKLPESVETLSALIHEGETVLLTEAGRVVAKVMPPDEAAEVEGRRLGPRAFMEKYRADRQRRPDLSVTAFLRKERDRA